MMAMNSLGVFLFFYDDGAAISVQEIAGAGPVSLLRLPVRRAGGVPPWPALDAQSFSLAFLSLV